MTRAATSITQIGTIAIPATDQDRSLAFYVDVLGFEKTRDVPFGNGQRWIEVAPPAGHHHRDRAARIVTARRRYGDPPDDAEGDHAALLATAVDVDPEILRFPGVPPMFSLRDPDGNRLYVIQGM